MPWERSKRMNWGLVWIGSMLLMLPACGTPKKDRIEAFICKPEQAYHQDGTLNPDRYTVDRACLRGVQQRLKACYRE